MSCSRIGSMVNGLTYLMNLLSLLGAYGSETTESNSWMDFDYNGVIGSADLLIMLSAYPYG